MRNTSVSIIKWLLWFGLFGCVSVVLSAIYFNWNDWGKFLLDVATTLSVQLFIAFLVFAWFVAIYNMGRIIFGWKYLSKNGLIWVFSGSTLLALPFINLVFQRPIDWYDFGQTGMIIIVGLFYGPFRPAVSDFKRKLRKRFFPKQLARFTTLQMKNANRKAYQDLLIKAQGDNELVERLVAYEYTRRPNASLSQLMDSAVISWERDNR